MAVHSRTGAVYALKCLRKSQVVALRQQENIRTERALLWATNHPFIIALYDTYRDAERVYLLLELVQGGELFSRLQQSEDGAIPLADARFYAACVLDALGYLHDRSVCYRDLKPENLLIDAQGYIKLVRAFGGGVGDANP